jgi:hypothetical protein
MMRARSARPTFHAAPDRFAGALVVLSIAIGVDCRPAAPSEGGKTPEGSSRREAGCGPPRVPGLLDAVRAEIEAGVRRFEDSAQARIEVTFDCPPGSPPLHARALRLEGHGGRVTILGIDADEAGFAVRLLRVGALSSSALGGAPPAVEVSRTHVGKSTAEILDRALAALSAHVQVSLAAPDDAGLHLRSILTTTHDEWLSVRISNDRGFDRRRDWQGYEGNFEEPARTPASLSLSALAALAGSAFTSAPVEDADRALFASFWPASGAVPAWAQRDMLAAGSALGALKLR